MKCPLRIFVVQQGLEVGTGYMPDCLKEECAWWDLSRERCAVLDLAVNLNAVGSVLLHIQDKMPHELQFRK